MKAAREIRVGNIFKMNNKLYLVLKAEFHKSTAGRRASTSEMKFKLKELGSDNRTELTVDALDKIDHVILDKKECQFLYKIDDVYTFMNNETFEQFEMAEDDLGDTSKLLAADAILNILFYEDSPVSVDLPTTVNLKITYTEPGIRGDTSGKATKTATLESGMDIQVPLFCNIGDVLKIDTRTFEYVERASI